VNIIKPERLEAIWLLLAKTEGALNDAEAEKIRQLVVTARESSATLVVRAG
jgi:hypothetical protein